MTLSVTDADTQTWNNGSWTATLIAPPGVPCCNFVITGSTAVPNQQQSGSLNGSGAASLTLTPTTSISPSGTQWQFQVCAQAAPTACYTANSSITGASQSVSLTPPGIRINLNQPQVRYAAYADTEVVNGNLGSFYFNLGDSTLHVCTVYTAGVCTFTSVSSGGGGGSGTVNTGVAGQVAYYPNSTNAVSSTSNLIFSGSNSTFAGSGQFGGTNPGLFLFGSTTVPVLPANSFGIFAPASTSFTSYGLQFSTTAPSGNQIPVCGTPVNGVSQCPWSSFSPLPTSPQTGDTILFNVNGDSLWDAANASGPSEKIYAINQTNNLQVVGPWGVAGVTVAAGESQNTVVPTATLNAGNKFTSPSTASTSTVLGISFGSNGNVALMGALAFYRWSFRAAIGNTTNVRYWMGLGCYNNTGVGNNSVLILNTTAYAADNPNKTTLGFRFSAGTDTHWMGVVDVASGGGGTLTTMDTGVTPDTNPHLFEMTTNAAGTSVSFFIDGQLKGTISSNLPNPASNGDSWVQRFFTGDNKNTTNAVSLTFYSMVTSLKY